MDKIIESLECLKDCIIDRDAETSVDMTTAVLLEMIGLFGDSPVMVKTFPFLEKIQNAVQNQEWDDAFPMVLALLAKLRRAQKRNSDVSSSISDERHQDLDTSVDPEERNHVGSETDKRKNIELSDLDSDVGRPPLAGRPLDIAAKLIGAENRDVDSIAAGIERMKAELPGRFLVVTWVTRAIQTRLIHAIWYLTSFGEEHHARGFAYAAVEKLIAGGCKREASAEAHGPQFNESRVSVVARKSLLVSGDGKPEADHVTFIVLGPFPGDILDDELVEMFGNAREKHALTDFFAFHGPNGCVPPEWLEQNLSLEEPGNLAYTLAALVPLAASIEVELELAARDNALAGHPELRAIEERIKTLQAEPHPPDGSIEEWRRSLDLDASIDLYEAKRLELAQSLFGQPEANPAEVKPAEPQEEFRSMFSDSGQNRIQLSEGFSNAAIDYAVLCIGGILSDRFPDSNISGNVVVGGLKVVSVWNNGVPGHCSVVLIRQQQRDNWVWVDKNLRQLFDELSALSDILYEVYDIANRRVLSFDSKCPAKVGYRCDPDNFVFNIDHAVAVRPISGAEWLLLGMGEDSVGAQIRAAREVEEHRAAGRTAGESAIDRILSRRTGAV